MSLKAIRKSLKLSQRAIACELGLKDSTWTGYELQRSRFPVDQAKRLQWYARTKGMLITLEDIYSDVKPDLEGL